MKKQLVVAFVVYVCTMSLLQGFATPVHAQTQIPEAKKIIRTIQPTVSWRVFKAGSAPPSAVATTPTPTQTAAQASRRLEKGKEKALEQVKKREYQVRKLSESFKKRKQTMFAADRTEIETMINNMQPQFASWRSEIKGASTIDALKSTQLNWIKKTRVYAEFKPKMNMMMRNAGFTKHFAQVNKRVEKLEGAFGKKNNSDKNKKYENVQKKLDTTKKAMEGVSDEVKNTKALIASLSPEVYNTDKGAYKAKLDEIRSNLKKNSDKLKNSFTHLKDVGMYMKNISNASPTPTP